MENTKAKRVGIIIITVIVVVCIAILVTVLLNDNNSKENIQGNSTNNETADKQQININKFSFIYDIDAVDEKWWDEINQTKNWHTNKGVYEARWKNIIGNTDGKLKVRPINFIHTMELGYIEANPEKEYYDIEIKGGNFLIPQDLTLLTDNSRTNNELNLYVLANDADLYRINLKIDKIPTNIELEQGKWKTITNEENGKIKVESYYRINEYACIHINYPNQVIGTKEQINKEVVLDLSEKVTEVITINSTNKKDKLSYYIELENIKLDENISILLKDMKVKSWNSGAPSITTSLQQYNTIILAYNAHEDNIRIVEYSSEKQKEQIEILFKYSGTEIEEYIYKGKKIYLEKGNSEANNIFRNKYTGILFEADGLYYSINYTDTTKATKLDKTDIENWIKKLCDGVVEFK